MSQQFRREMAMPPSLAPFARRVAIHAGGRTHFDLHVYDVGHARGAPLVLIHGLADEADTWRHVIPTLAAHHRVIALDLPGFGRSSKPRTSYTLDAFADALLALLDALELDRATLIGNSLGGMIAHLVTLRAPQRVERLVLVAGLLLLRRNRGRLDRATLEMMFRTLPVIGELYYNQLRRDPDAAFATLRSFYSDFDGLPPADRDFLYQRVNERVWSDAQRRSYLAVRRGLPVWLARNRDIGERVADIATPTLVVWGEDDAILPLAYGRGLVEAQRLASLVTIPRAGHLPQQERPREFLDALAPFLRDRHSQTHRAERVRV